MTRFRILLTATTAISLMATMPLAAQDAGTDTTRRIDRIERELRAVQRRVFPGSDGGMFTPEVQPADTASVPGGAGLSTPISDLNARVDAIESQLAALTGQIEQQGFRQRELEASIARLRSELSGRIDALAPSAPAAAATTPTPSPAPRPAPAPAPAPRPASTTPASATPATRTPAPAPATTTRPATAPAATPTGGDAARRARVEAVEVPSTGNAAEDAYIYGYRLWEARLYPEAQVQLQRVLDTHPTHRRASYAGNLLGRAYLDNGQPSLAVRAFYDNYRERARGERAPDSVYFMGMALIQLDRRTDACRTFDEFDRIYGAEASQALKDRVAAGRTQARC